MIHAQAEDVKDVYAHFTARKDIFPHIRFDYVQRACAEGRCVYERNVPITYQQYKKTTRIGTVRIPKGDVILHQIVNGGEKGAASDVFRSFIYYVRERFGTTLWLAVRSDNDRARAFYERHGMRVVGTVDWKKGALPGVVYALPASSLPL